MPQPLQRRRGGRAGSSPLAAQFVSAQSQALTVASNATLQVPASGGFSLAGWFRPTAAGSYRALVGKIQNGVAATDCYGLQIAHPVATDVWELFVVNNGLFLATDADGTAPVTLNVRAFVCGTYNRSNGTGLLTINQTSFSANLNAADINNGTAPFCIGERGAGTNYFDGQADSIGFWTRTLTVGETTTLYNNGVPLRRDQLSGTLLTSLGSYWDYDHGNFNDDVGTNNLTSVNNVLIVPALS